MSESTFPAMARIPGLDPEKIYRVKALKEAGSGKRMQVTEPGWMQIPNGISMSGAELESIGVRPPILPPENAILIEISSGQ